MAVRQQDGDGWLLPCGLTVLDQAVTERRRDTRNTSSGVGVRDPRAVNTVGRSRLVSRQAAPNRLAMSVSPARPT